METIRRIPMAIILKTCGVLLGPPGHLVNLMLKVAAKIAAGEWRGLVFGRDEAGEQMPVQWDDSDGEFSSWGDDDDYFVSKMVGNIDTNDGGIEREGETECADASRSWEVD